MKKLTNCYFASTIISENDDRYYTYLVSRKMLENPKLPFYRLAKQGGIPFVSLVGVTEERRRIATSCIVASEERIITTENETNSEITVTTASGSQYKVAKHKDFIALCKAYENGLPILVDFVIIKDKNDDIIVKGYTLSESGIQELNKKVVKSEYNIFKFSDGTKAFVNWATVDKRLTKYLWKIAQKSGKAIVKEDVAFVFGLEKFKKNANVLLADPFLNCFPKFYLETEWPLEEELEGEKMDTIFSTYFNKS